MIFQIGPISTTQSPQILSNRTENLGSGMSPRDFHISGLRLVYNRLGEKLRIFQIDILLRIFKWPYLRLWAILGLEIVCVDLLVVRMCIWGE